MNQKAIYEANKILAKSRYITAGPVKTHCYINRYDGERMNKTQALVFLQKVLVPYSKKDEVKEEVLNELDYLTREEVNKLNGQKSVWWFFQEFFNKRYGFKIMLSLLHTDYKNYYHDEITNKKLINELTYWLEENQLLYKWYNQGKNRKIKIFF